MQPRPSSRLLLKAAPARRVLRLAASHESNLVSGLTPEEIRRASLAFARSLMLEDEQHRMAGNIPEAYGKA
jgi:hypothetical protein